MAIFQLQFSLNEMIIISREEEKKTMQWHINKSVNINVARSLPWQHYQKHPGQLIRVRDLTFKVHPLQLFVHKKQGQIFSFEIKGTGGRINDFLILVDTRMHLFLDGQTAKISHMTSRGTKTQIFLKQQYNKYTIHFKASLFWYITNCKCEVYHSEQ